MWGIHTHHKLVSYEICQPELSRRERASLAGVLPTLPVLARDFRVRVHRHAIISWGRLRLCTSPRSRARLEMDIQGIV